MLKEQRLKPHFFFVLILNSRLTSVIWTIKWKCHVTAANLESFLSNFGIGFGDKRIWPRFPTSNFTALLQFLSETNEGTNRSTVWHTADNKILMYFSQRLDAVRKISSSRTPAKLGGEKKFSKPGKKIYCDSSAVKASVLSHYMMFQADAISMKIARVSGLGKNEANLSWLITQETLLTRRNTKHILEQRTANKIQDKMNSSQEYKYLMSGVLFLFWQSLHI